jgi:hypothetical protein
MNTMFSYFKPKDGTVKRKQKETFSSEDEDAPKHHNKKQKQECKHAPPKKNFTKKVAASVWPFKPNCKAESDEHIIPNLSSTASDEYLRRKTPFAERDSTPRGGIAENGDRFVWRESKIVEPEGNFRTNGKRLGKNCRPYDYGIDCGDGKVIKIEVKNSRMHYEKQHQRWVLQFAKVKQDKFDELHLVFEGFDGMRFYKWNGKNYSTAGEAEERNGGHVLVYTPIRTLDADEAHKKLIAKMKEENEFIAFLPYSFLVKHCNVDLTDTEIQFKGVPLANFQKKPRGDVLEATVRSFLSKNLNKHVEDALITSCVNGKRRSKNQTSCDFVMDGERVEVKSCMMSWDLHDKCWRLQFQKVKKEEYDVLCLAWMSKKGIHIMKHDGKAGIGDGDQINFSGPGGKTGYEVVSAAEMFLLKNMKEDKLEYTAFLKFGKGLQEHIMDIVNA